MFSLKTAIKDKPKREAKSMPSHSNWAEKWQLQHCCLYTKGVNMVAGACVVMHTQLTGDLCIRVYNVRYGGVFFDSSPLLQTVENSSLPAIHSYHCKNYRSPKWHAFRKRTSSACSISNWQAQIVDHTGEQKFEVHVMWREQCMEKQVSVQYSWNVLV